jgi:hypothetical protein
LDGLGIILPATCYYSIDGCHCERSEAISVLLAIEIATAYKTGLAMTDYWIPHSAQGGPSAARDDKMSACGRNLTIKIWMFYDKE